MAPSADAGSPYHPGELEVQAQAGVPEAARRVGQIIRPEIPPTAAAFLAAQPLVVAGSVGSDGSVWASLLTGPPGFAAARSERAIQIAPFDTHDDRFLERVAATGTIALLAIEPATRRRVRLNGRAVVASDGSIAVTTEQVYANCPKYIQAR
ncbi:MAG: pyridoxamine 5'-phosphate oxidase family protein, partial [Chloroflexia bacterium]|nr:pyridoxamine 5'-phosphate oxidase family protein [Chloroflexia bacterium]